MGIVGRGLQRVNDYLEAPPRGPRYHGDKNDPRYPSPRGWRVFFAPMIDIAFHIGLAATVLVKVSGLAGVALAIVAYVVVSFIHTVAIQRIAHATLGKVVLGLVLIRGDDGNWPTTGRLIVWYFIRVLITALTLADGFGGTVDPDPHLVAVRRRDVNALRSGHGLAPASQNPPSAHSAYGHHPYPNGNQQPPSHYPPNPHPPNNFPPPTASGPTVLPPHRR
ncbi:hypothetical protein [Nocardia sp. NPDC052112]|uniref:hypothetical protein n=1 Tax=Nocardia sp. NPDC052112 TaxID=3155646 RepID=UPI0034222C98